MKYPVAAIVEDGQTFDYSALTRQEQDYLHQKSQKIHRLIEKTAELVWDLGKELAEVRDFLRHNKTGGFAGWLKLEFQWGRRTAYNYIAVYKNFDNCATLAQLAPTILYFLAAPSTPGAARQEVIERAAQGEKITSELDKQIRSRHTIDVEAETVEDIEASSSTRKASSDPTTEPQAEQDELPSTAELPNANRSRLKLGRDSKGQAVPGTLPNFDMPSDIKVDKLAADNLGQITQMDETNNRGQAQPAAAEQQAEELARRLLALKEEYAPVGYNTDIENIEFPYEYFDAVITDPTSALSNDSVLEDSGTQADSSKPLEDKMGWDSLQDWIPIVAAELKPGGSLVVICSEAHLFTLHSIATQYGLRWQQTLIWWNQSGPLLRPKDRKNRFEANHQYIYVAANRGAIPYFGFNDLNEHFPNRQLGTVLDGLPPMELAKLVTLAYVPPDGRVLDPFARSATVSVSAKLLGRKATWLETDKQLFHQAESRIEQSPYHWEQ